MEKHEITRKTTRNGGKGSKTEEITGGRMMEEGKETEELEI